MRKGTKMSELQRLRCSLSHTGIHYPNRKKQPPIEKGFRKKNRPEWCERISKSNLGRKTSFETIEKMKKSLKGRIVSPETRKKLSIAALGSKRTLESRKKMSIAATIHGLTPLHARIRRSTEYKLWRTAVFERDNFVCIWGGKAHGNKINADHIKPFALYPELRFAIDNGRTLCEACHKKTDTYGRRAKTLPIGEI